LSHAARNWNLVWWVTGSELLALWKGRKPRSPSPRPSRQRRGRTIGRVATNRGLQPSRVTADRAPSPWGEGRGEGERGHRIDAAAQNVFGPRETEPQFLAALDKNVGAPPDHPAPHTDLDVRRLQRSFPLLLWRRGGRARALRRVAGLVGTLDSSSRPGEVEIRRPKSEVRRGGAQFFRWRRFLSGSPFNRRDAKSAERPSPNRC